MYLCATQMNMNEHENMNIYKKYNTKEIWYLAASFLAKVSG